MEYSPEYYQRQHYMSILTVPPISIVKSQLGEQLSQIFINSCPKPLRNEMRLDSKLKGPGPNLWVSPSDLLVGKVVLKPPLTGKHVKALTHQGILELGQELEAQWLRQLENEKERALTYQEELLMLMAKRDKDAAVFKALRLQEEEYEYKLGFFKEEFYEMLQREIRSHEDALKDSYRKLLDEKTLELLSQQESLKRQVFDEAVMDTVQNLSAKFLEDLKMQEENLNNEFTEKLLEKDEQFLEAMLMHEEACAQVLKHLKHVLQCNYIASLMYVLCLERRKCLHEQQMLVDCYHERIEKLNRAVDDLDFKVKKLEEDNDKKQRQLIVRDNCLKGVLKQFQKFINFALKASPKQAEFLINIDKMMTFELAQVLAKDIRTQRRAKQVMPWHPECPNTEYQSAKTLYPDDYHNCLNVLCSNSTCNPEIVHRERERELPPDELYAVTYKDRLYVREDFRNKISKGLVRDTSSVLWSKDIKHLIHLIRKASEQKVDEAEEVGEKELSLAEAASYRSNVHFRCSSPNNIGLLGTQDSLVIQKSIKSSYIDSHACPDHRPTMEQPPEVAPAVPVAKILAATDSIELLKVRILNSQQPEIEKALQNEPIVESLPVPAPSTVTLKLSVRSSKIIHKRQFSTLSQETLKLTKSKHEFKKNSKVSLRSPNTRRQSSKLLMKVDLDNTTSSLKKKSYAYKRRHFSVTSKLSHHRDSLEVLKEHSKSQDTKLRDVLLPKDNTDSIDRISQEFVIMVPDSERPLPKVNFKRIKEVFKEIIEPEKPWRMYEDEKVSVTGSTTPADEEAEENFLLKENVAKIVGLENEDHLVESKKFTIHRIHSLVEILKDDPSLIRLFTAGGQ